jgi:hypothetical protein
VILRPDAYFFGVRRQALCVIRTKVVLKKRFIAVEAPQSSIIYRIQPLLHPTGGTLLVQVVGAGKSHAAAKRREMVDMVQSSS